MEIKEKNISKTSEARRKASKKYNQNHYKSITYQAKIGDYEQIKAYAESKGISISKLCKLCVEYCLSQGVELDTQNKEK